MRDLVADIVELLSRRGEFVFVLNAHGGGVEFEPVAEPRIGAVAAACQKCDFDGWSAARTITTCTIHEISDPWLSR